MAMMEDHKMFILRRPLSAYGYKMWELVKNTSSLDLNSLSHYFLIPHHFVDSSIIAFSADEIAGFVTSYFPPG